MAKVYDTLQIEECPICLEMFENLNNTLVLKCGHRFHHKCISIFCAGDRKIYKKRYKRLKMNVTGKDGSREKAIQMLPKFSSFFQRKKDNGRSDASLIAMYGFMFGESVENKVRQITTKV